VSDPLALVPLALAARGGRVDGHGAGELVAAGITLLQRCAPLVRALDGRGAVFVNPLAAPAEIAYQLADANAGAVFTVSALEEKLPAGFARVLLDDAPAHAVARIDGQERRVDLGAHFGIDLEGAGDAAGRDEEAAIVYTSAMEGTPLGAILTHRNLLANARATVAAAELDASAVSLAILPFSHLFGFTVTLMAPLLAGGRVITMARFNPPRALDVLRSEDVSLLVGVPSVFAGLLAAAEREGGRIAAPTLRVCICGGAPLEVELQERWHAATGVELRQGYGLTEAAPVCLFNRISLPNRLGTLGVPLPGVDVAIRDGEICVRGENVFPGYVTSGAKGLRLEDGWLRTGDRGTIDAEGYVTFTGVMKPMFTRNGFNIYPKELERVVGTMPGVQRVSVRAIPDPTRENDIALEITGAVSTEAVATWCAARLSVYKQPTRIEISSH